MLARLRSLLARRRLALAALAAMIIFLMSVLLALTMAGKPAPRQTGSTATVFATATLTATAPMKAPTQRATPTPKPHPLPAPKNNPPPPAHHQPPPTPTPSPIPPTATPCATADCPTATPMPPTATPGPCQPGGPPYYVTPTATPTTDQIAQAITGATNSTSNHLAEDPNIPTGQDVTIPAIQQEAIAWQESGWQQNIVACDGGIGLMQLMPATASWLNTHFGTNYDVYSLNGNAHLGAEYLQYYYQFYLNVLYSDYASYCQSQPNAQCVWDTPWPDSSDGATVRDIVISVYNEGAGTMSNYGIINWWYVNDVLTWMNQSPPPWQG